MEELTGVHPDLFTNQKEKVVEEYFLQFQKNGDCFFLDENNGNFSCRVYEARPKICKNYPAKPLQQEFCEARTKLMGTDADL